MCLQTALKYSCTNVTHVFTVSACVRGGGSNIIVILLLRFAPRHQTQAHNIHLVQQHHHSQRKNNRVLTFAAQNMAADRHNPSPGFGDPCAPSAPNTPSVSFHRLGWPPFPKADKLCDEWSPNLSRPYGPSVCPSTVSCVILTRYALI